MAEMRWIEPGEWRYLISIRIEDKYRAKLKAKMVRDICMRCASEEEKAERKKEIKAIDQFRRDETAKITQKILDDLKGQPVRSLGKDRYVGEIAFKDEALRDEIFKTLSAPKGWRFSRMEDGGGDERWLVY
tara:strand:- start:460 stop:852 length:393 start_codon:yes stop_codon:yes gene_type:complete